MLLVVLCMVLRAAFVGYYIFLFFSLVFFVTSSSAILCFWFFIFDVYAICAFGRSYKRRLVIARRRYVTLTIG